MPLLDDRALIDRLLSHIDAGTTDLADDTWREPVEHYWSPERLHQEVELVLRRLPVPFCPSAALPGPGSYVARPAGGVPLVAVRGRDGQVRVFRNACRHRGTALVSGPGCAQSLVCPYHRWVYRLDGALRHVPHEHGFPGLDRSQRGLVPVASVERGGLVVVDQDGSAGGLGGPGGSGGLDELYELDELPDVIGGDQELLDSGELTVEVNWKILVEGFLEGYHIKATHPETFFPFGYDNLTVVESAGRHSRVTFPFRRIEALRDRPEEQRHIDGLATVVHHLFPNVIVAQLSHHTTMVVLEPIAVDRTTLVTYRLAERGTAARASAARDVDFVALGALEDQDMARAVQLGLASGGNDVLEFGRFEGAITHFHRQLATLLGDEPASPGPETSDRP